MFSLAELMQNKEDEKSSGRVIVKILVDSKTN
jgi:hypothetical protein